MLFPYLRVRTNISDWRTLSRTSLAKKVAEVGTKSYAAYFMKFVNEWDSLLNVTYLEGRARLKERADKARAELGFDDIQEMLKEQIVEEFEQKDNCVLFSTDDDDYYHPDILCLIDFASLKKRTAWWYEYTLGDELNIYKIGEVKKWNFKHSNNFISVKGKREGLQCIGKEKVPNLSKSFATATPWSRSYFRICFEEKDPYWRRLTLGQQIVRTHQLFIQNSERCWDQIPEETWWKPHWKFALDLSKEALGSRINQQIDLNPNE